MEKFTTYNVVLEITGVVLKKVHVKIEAINAEQAKIIAEMQYPGTKAIKAIQI